MTPPSTPAELMALAARLRAAADNPARPAGFRAEALDTAVQLEALADGRLATPAG